MIYTNKYNIPEALVRAFQWDEYDGNNHDGLSVTTLIAPPHQVNLRKTKGVNKEQDISDKYYTFLGSIAHSILEKIIKSDTSGRYISEQRFHWDFEHKPLYGETVKGRIHGQLDLYDSKECAIQDYKFTSKYQVKNNADKTEWTQQLNILAYILRKHNLPVKKLQIIALSRDFQIKDKFSYDMPKTFVNVIDMEVWPDEKIEAMIAERLLKHQSAHELNECTFEERWSTVPVYAVMKQGAVRAVKLWSNEKDALDFIEGHKERKKLSIEFRPGTNKRCENYCNVTEHCDFYKINIKVENV